MSSLIRNFLAGVMLMLAGAPAFSQATQDDAQIRQIATTWEHAWNIHDMKMLAGLFTKDADFVNVGAKHWKGQQMIEVEHTRRLGQFMESTWTNKDVSIQYLKPDLALVHVSWGIAGDKDPDGVARQPREGLFTWVIIKQHGAWNIRAAQNTNVSGLQPHETSAAGKNSGP